MKLNSFIKLREYYIFRGLPQDTGSINFVSGIEPEILVKQTLMDEISEEAQVFYGATVEKGEEITIFGIPFTRYTVGYSYDNCGGSSHFFVHEVKNNLQEIVKYPL